MLVHLFSTLCQIWEDVLGFENAEFYIKRWPELDGLCFKDVLISFPDAIPCGIKVAADGGKIIINPDDSYVLRDGDEVLVIAEDDDTYAPGPLPEVIFLFYTQYFSTQFIKYVSWLKKLLSRVVRM